VLAIVLFDTVYYVCDLIWVLVFSATFSHISAISWRPVLVVEEAEQKRGCPFVVEDESSTQLDLMSGRT
jgi:hypothetical protein